MFELTNLPINIAYLPPGLKKSHHGSLVTFEGFVRDINEGKKVRSLEYQAFHEMAEVEGQKIMNEALKLFGVSDLYAVHRYGHLEIGEVAVRVAVFSMHRKEGFLASQYCIDEIKKRVPIWKKEHYLLGPSEWVACHQCQELSHGHQGDHHKHL